MRGVSSFSMYQFMFVHDKESSFTDREYEVNCTTPLVAINYRFGLGDPPYFMKLKFKFSWTEGGFISFKLSRSLIKASDNTLTDYSEEIVGTTTAVDKVNIMVKFISIPFLYTGEYNRPAISNGKTYRMYGILEV